MEFVSRLFAVALGWGFIALIAHGASRKLVGEPLTWWFHDDEATAGSLRAKFGRWLLGVALFCFGLFWFGDVMQITSIKHNPDLFTVPGFWASVGWMILALFSNKAGGLSGLRGSAQFVADKDATKLRQENAREGKGAEVQLGLLSNGTRFEWQTDKHVLVVASSGSGKGTDLLIPNLLTYDGPVFVLDPKGENARATARHRSTFGPVHCLDPWGLTGRPLSRFNPLGRLTQPEHAADVATGAAALAGALVLPDHGNNRFFTDSARQLIEALIAYAATDEHLSPVADLKLVRRLLTLHIRPTLEAMVKSTRGPDSIRSNAGRMLSLSEREFGQILSSAVTETAFLDDPRLQAALSAEPGGQIDFGAWQQQAMSVFVCLPPQYFKTFNRWLRLVVTAALDEKMRQLNAPPKPVLFMLDELATLERMQPVEDAVGLARGYGVQVWSIFQDLGQMKDIYKERASSFIGNSGLRLFFGVQEYETAKYVSDTLGTQTIEVERMQGGQVVDTQYEGRNLLNPDEVMRLPQDVMITFIPAQNPLILKRVSYFKDSRLRGLWDDPRS